MSHTYYAMFTSNQLFRKHYISIFALLPKFLISDNFIPFRAHGPIYKLQILELHITHSCGKCNTFLSGYFCPHVIHTKCLIPGAHLYPLITLIHCLHPSYLAINYYYALKSLSLSGTTLLPLFLRPRAGICTTGTGITYFFYGYLPILKG